MGFYKANSPEVLERRPQWMLAITALAIAAALAFAGCASLSGDDDTGGDDAATADDSEPLPPTIANVGITYKRPGDALSRATVTKYFGAETLRTEPRGPGKTESIVRFDGGVPIWQFKSAEGTIG
ncbi:MAG TPA: hypothetical protein VMT58_07845, partial [Candidatus Binataceae bacterium]|nr:hypothetical protein [Candidatus Binataceae bacterium]